MKILLQNVSTHRDEWLALRSKTVGSSEIATIAGVGYGSALDLWLQKTGRKPPIEDNEYMRLGRHMESYIGGLFSRATNKTALTADVLLAHPVHESFTASPDFWVFNSPTDGDCSGILECKNVNYRQADKWENGQCPDFAQCQLQWQLAISGISGGYVDGLVGADPSQNFIREFESDSTIQDKLFEAAHAFLDCVRTDTPPVAVRSDRDFIESDLILDESVAELPEEAMFLLHQYVLAKQNLSTANKDVERFRSQMEDVRARVEQLQGSASRGIAGSFEVRLNRVNKKAYSVPESSYINFALYKDGKKI